GCDEDGEIIAVKKVTREYDLGILVSPFADTVIVGNHENIIKFLGYGIEKTTEVRNTWGKPVSVLRIETIAFCFEYMQNGSLERHLSDEFHGHDWCTRYKIIKGTCDGLNYLHEGQNSSFYHLNLKPSNILLDENMIPKIGDCLSTFKEEGRENGPTRQISSFHVRYLPPEFITKQVISDKFDIYSLGVIILEMITGTSEFQLLEDKKTQEFIKL
ncbi:hypothetical protein EJB05_53388, partial [Eragrostis curvula]